MKTATITITFEQEKLKALQFYAGKREANLQGELDEFLLKLYEKYVPAQTREYIESLSGQTQSQHRRPSRPIPAAAPVSADVARRQQ